VKDRLTPLSSVGTHLCSVFSELSQLIADGKLPPPSPITRLGYEMIPEALRLIREGTQVGKIVISDGHNTKLAVPVRVQT
jgi:NADPH-dependent curcumin reductase CurA